MQYKMSNARKKLHSWNFISLKKPEKKIKEIIRLTQQQKCEVCKSSMKHTH